MVIVLDGGEFFRAIDWFIMEDAVEFKCQVKARKVDVEFGTDCSFGVEQGCQIGIAFPQPLLKPDLEFRAACAGCLVSVAVKCGTAMTTEVVLANLRFDFRELGAAPIAGYGLRTLLL